MEAMFKEFKINHDSILEYIKVNYSSIDLDFIHRLEKEIENCIYWKDKNEFVKNYIVFGAYYFYHNNNKTMMILQEKKHINICHQRLV